MSYNPTLFEASDWWKASNCGTIANIAKACEGAHLLASAGACEIKDGNQYRYIYNLAKNNKVQEKVLVFFVSLQYLNLVYQN